MPLSTHHVSVILTNSHMLTKTILQCIPATYQSTHFYHIQGLPPGLKATQGIIWFTTGALPKGDAFNGIASRTRLLLYKTVMTGAFSPQVPDYMSEGGKSNLSL